MRTGVGILLAAVTLSGAEPARRSPAFSIFRSGAPALTLGQYKGKVVALAFVSTGCPHCQELTRVLSGIARDYAARGVEVLGCAFNEDAERALPEFLERFRPGFPVGWNTRVAVMSYLQRTIFDQRPLYVPHMVFLDRGGAIRGDYEGGSAFFQDANGSIRAQLEKLLKTAATSAPASHR